MLRKEGVTSRQLSKVLIIHTQPQNISKSKQYKLNLDVSIKGPNKTKLPYKGPPLEMFQFFCIVSVMKYPIVLYAAN